MSLSEQIGRVDGSQNDILKTILKAFGVTIGTEKIDAIADLAEAASNLQDDGILSTATKTAFGLDSSASPDDALAILANAAILKDGNLQLPNGGTVPGIRTEYGTYKGTGQYGSGHPNKITVPFNLQIVFLLGQYSGYPRDAIMIYGHSTANTSLSEYGLNVTWGSNFVSWYDYNAGYQFNDSGSTYYYFAIGVEN